VLLQHLPSHNAAVNIPGGIHTDALGPLCSIVVDSISSMKNFIDPSLVLSM
jgi:hypothetical protein